MNKVVAGLVGVIIRIVPHSRKIGLLHQSLEVFCRLFSAHEVEKSLRIVRYEPGLLENVAFHASVVVVFAVPNVPAAVAVALAHPTDRGVKYLFVVVCTLGKQLLVFAVTKLLGEHRNAPIGVYVFKGVGHVVGHISEGIHILGAKASRIGIERCFKANIIRAVDVKIAYALAVCIEHYRNSGIAYHAVCLVVEKLPTGE